MGIQNKYDEIKLPSTDVYYHDKSVSQGVLPKLASRYTHDIHRDPVSNKPKLFTHGPDNRCIWTWIEHEIPDNPFLKKRMILHERWLEGNYDCKEGRHLGLKRVGDFCTMCRMDYKQMVDSNSSDVSFLAALEEIDGVPLPEKIKHTLDLIDLDAEKRHDQSRFTSSSTAFEDVFAKKGVR